jgi:hypothetical protein
VHEPDFIARLNRVTARARVLRQRDVARVVLFIAELLKLDMAKVEERFTEVIAEQDVESENATIIEAIELDSFYVEAKRTGGELEVEALRLRVQTSLRNAREFVDLSRNRFAAVLAEMGFSKAKGPTWKRIIRDGRKFMVIVPSLLPDADAEGASGASGASVLHMEKGQTGQTGQTLSQAADDASSLPIEVGPGEAVVVLTGLLRELGGDRPPGAPQEPLLLRARDRGIVQDRAMSILKRLREEGSIFVPRTGFYQLTESLR